MNVQEALHERLFFRNEGIRKLRSKKMNLEECYESMDSDYDDVMRRLGSETLVRKFVLKFLDDTSFQGLKEGLENQDAELAFRSAHTLKGVCMNLGFTKLFEVSSALTEELRDKEIKENCTEMFEVVEQEYIRTIEAIKGLC